DSFDCTLSQDSYDTSTKEFHFSYSCTDKNGTDDFSFDLDYSSGSYEIDFEHDSFHYTESDYSCSTDYDGSGFDFDLDCQGKSNSDNEVDLDYRDDGSVEFDFDFDLDSSYDIDVSHDDGGSFDVQFDRDSDKYNLLTVDIEDQSTEVIVSDIHGMSNLGSKSLLAIGDWNNNDYIDILYRDKDEGISRVDAVSGPAQIVDPSVTVSLEDGVSMPPEPTVILAMTQDTNSNGKPEIWWYDEEDSKVLWVDKSDTSGIHEADWGGNLEKNNSLPGVGPGHDFDENGEIRWPVVFNPDSGDKGAGVVTSDADGSGGKFTLLESDDRAKGNPLAAANVSDGSRAEFVFTRDHDIGWVNSDFSGTEKSNLLTDSDADRVRILGDYGVTASVCVSVRGLDIFNSFIRSGGVKSRTESVFTNNLDFTDKQGQYRLFSGAKASLAKGNFSGVLIRQNRICGAGDPNDDAPCQGNEDYTCFHDELAADVAQNGSGTGGSTVSNGTDGRRVWTSAPHPSFFNYDDPNSESEFMKSEPHGKCFPYHSAYAPLQGPSNGDFGTTYLDGVSSTSSQIVHRRLPVEEKTLRNSLVGGGDATDDEGSIDENDEPFADNVNFYKWFGTWNSSDATSDCNGTPNDSCQSRDAFEAMVDEIRGRAESSKGRVLSGILNSDPAVADPPEEGVPSESYRAYQARMSKRPTMVYQATHDGALHAFYAGGTDQDKSPPAANHVIDRPKDHSPASTGSTSGTTARVEKQREAWSFVPHMLHDELANFSGKKPKLMDGETTIADARLCYDKAGYNNNFNACKIHCSSADSTQPGSYDCSSGFGSTTCVPKDMRFRSVLVQGLGQAGSGYFALDVARPGGPDREDTSTTIEHPDPIPLWEFSPEWAAGQINWMINNGHSNLVGGSVSAVSGCDRGWSGHGQGARCEHNDNKDMKFLGPNPTDTDGDGKKDVNRPEIKYDPSGPGSCTATYEVPHDSTKGGGKGGGGGGSSDKWKTVRDSAADSMMGDSVGAAEIGTVLMPPLSGDSSGTNIRRSVAMFGDGDGGATSIFGGAKSITCTGGVEHAVGYGAIYIVDLQTGSLLRRFTEFHDPLKLVSDDAGPKPFPADITGSVTMFENGPGKLTTRAFVGGAEGRIYRIDLTDPDPANWKVSLFFDPTAPDSKLETPELDTPVGPVTGKPAVALGRRETTNGDPVVVYGIGMPGDNVDPNAHQAILSIRETYDARSKGVPGEMLWYVDESNGLEPAGDAREKMMSKPKIFNGYAYFSTYKNTSGSACIKGESRIWGLKYDGKAGVDLASTGTLPPGAFDCSSLPIDCTDDNGDGNGEWVRPSGSSLIQGVTIAPGKQCQFDPTQSGISRFSSGSSSSGEGPQIVANTGGVESGTDSGEFASGSDGINRAEIGAKQPQDFTVPMSWSVIDR
ncbi:MAG: hypothetical protein ABEK29_09570, partial [Bradymonadaceae bacterium]